jgi:hypothetical protein
MNQILAISKIQGFGSNLRIELKKRVREYIQDRGGFVEKGAFVCMEEVESDENPLCILLTFGRKTHGGKE